MNDHGATGTATVRFTCLLGRCDALRAEVYLRAELPADASRGSLTGTLTGPECRHATTLPVNSRITPLGGGEPSGVVVGRTILTEPAFWTPDLPNLYRLEASLTVGGAEVAACRRRVGLRRLGVRGRSLWLDGRRFVPRGLASSALPADVDRFRQAALTAVAAEPSEDFLERCDHDGLAVIARIGESPSGPADAVLRIDAWARHPSVLVAVFPPGMPGDHVAAVIAETKATRSTLLIATTADGTRPPQPQPEAADAVVVNLPRGLLPHEDWRSVSPPLPLIACRHDLDVGCDPARTCCDDLQRDLAGWGTADGPLGYDWAGYLCLPPEPSVSRA